MDSSAPGRNVGGGSAEHEAIIAAGQFFEPESAASRACRPRADLEST